MNQLTWIFQFQVFKLFQLDLIITLKEIPQNATNAFVIMCN
jgi:hypothetical protein